MIILFFKEYIGWIRNIFKRAKGVIYVFNK